MAFTLPDHDRLDDDLVTADQYNTLGTCIEEVQTFLGNQALTGVLKANGTSPMTAAEVGVDIVTPLTVRTEIGKMGAGIVIDDGVYNAFPGVCRRADGTLYMVYRKGQKHLEDLPNANSAKVMYRISTDGGITWSGEVQILTDATYDPRDPSVGQYAIGGASGTMLLTYDLSNYNVDGSCNAYVRASTDAGVTWGPAVGPIPNSGPAAWDEYTATTMAPVRLSNGHLLLGVFGRNSGATNFSAKCLRSTDNGITWSVLSDIATDGIQNWQEPILHLLADGTLLCTLRHANALTIATSVSTDNGATWSTPVDRFDGASRATMATLSNGTIACVYRSNDRGHQTLNIDAGYAGLGGLRVLTVTAGGASITVGPEIVPDYERTAIGFEYAMPILVESMLGIAFSFNRTGTNAAVCWTFIPESSLLKLPSLVADGVWAAGVVHGHYGAFGLAGATGDDLRQTALGNWPTCSATGESGAPCGFAWDSVDFANVTWNSYIDPAGPGSNRLNRHTTGRVIPVSMEYGGILLDGFTKPGGSEPSPVVLRGNAGTTTPTVPAFDFRAYKWNGTNDATAMVNDEIIFWMRGGVNASVMTLTAKGDLTLSGAVTADIHVARTQALTDAATVAWDTALGAVGTVTLGGNRTLANPTNLKAGGRYTLVVTQDGTGSRTLAYDTGYKFEGGTAPTLTTTAAAVDVLEFVAVGTSLLCVAVYKDVK